MALTVKADVIDVQGNGIDNAEWIAPMETAFDTRFDSATIIHLTFVGSLAGKPYCGASKEEQGAMFVHAVHAHYSTFNHPKLCPKCKAMWDESAND